jgi:hypothetical protein
MKTALHGGWLLLLLSTHALALDYQVHGYAAQGFVWSSDNRVFGDSPDGSLQYHEAGINGTVAPLPSLIVSAQLATRSAGVTDKDTLRLDYALADYRFLSGTDANAGIRVGKVKNPMGLYNDTRDVVFTRPGVLMPSLYGDQQNQRDLTFAAQGVQLYGDLVRGAHHLSVTGTASNDRSVGTTEKQLLITLDGPGGQLIPFNLDVVRSWNMQIADSIDEGRWRLAYSHFYGRFRLDAIWPRPIEPIEGSFGASLDILSVQFNAERWSVTAEYAVNPNKDYLTLGSLTILDTYQAGDSAYLQADLRLTSHWTLMTRLDDYSYDRNDRSGTAYVAAHPGADRASRFARDAVVGFSWRSAEHWGVWGELHWVDGTATLQPLANVGHTEADHWTLFMMMAAYRF